MRLKTESETGENLNITSIVRYDLRKRLQTIVYFSWPKWLGILAFANINKRYFVFKCSIKTLTSVYLYRRVSITYLVIIALGWAQNWLVVL